MGLCVEVSELRIFISKIHMFDFKFLITIIHRLQLVHNVIFGRLTNLTIRISINWFVLSPTTLRFTLNAFSSLEFSWEIQNIVFPLIHYVNLFMSGLLSTLLHGLLK